MLGIIALLLTSIRDDKVGLILAGLAITSILAVRKLGYLEYITTDKVLDWFADVTDETGLNRDRRTFLSNQVAISRSENIYEFWYRTIHAARKINLDAVLLELHEEYFSTCDFSDFAWEEGLSQEFLTSGNGRCFIIELPLVANGKSYGTLHLKKSVEQGGYDRVLLRRIEHLRRSVTNTLESFSKQSLTRPELLRDRRRPAGRRAHIWLKKQKETIKRDGYRSRKFKYVPTLNRWCFREGEETMETHPSENLVEPTSRTPVAGKK